MDGLRVADCSVFPYVSTGNTKAPCVVVSERTCGTIYPIALTQARRATREEDDGTNVLLVSGIIHTIEFEVRFLDENLLEGPPICSHGEEFS